MTVGPRNESMPPVWRMEKSVWRLVVGFSLYTQKKNKKEQQSNNIIIIIIIHNSDGGTPKRQFILFPAIVIERTRKKNVDKQHNILSLSHDGGTEWIFILTRDT